MGVAQAGNAGAGANAMSAGETGSASVRVFLSNGANQSVALSDPRETTRWASSRPGARLSRPLSRGRSAESFPLTQRDVIAVARPHHVARTALEATDAVGAVGHGLCTTVTDLLDLCGTSVCGWVC